jgi:hypothetical protein
MKRLLILLCWTILTCSCSTFTESRIVDNQDELKEIFEIGLKNNIKKSTWGDEDIDGLNWRLQKRGIDYFEIRLTSDNHSRELMDLDSIEVFTQKSDNIFDDQDNIVYDFARTPRQLGSYIIENASYDQKMVTDRWYLVTIGFD